MRCHLALRTRASLTVRGAVRGAGERGRCVVAARDFSAGEEVFTSRPCAYALLPEQTGRRCDACLSRPAAPLLRCAGCKRQRYCSQARGAASAHDACAVHLTALLRQACQRDAWAAHHRAECGALEALEAAAPSAAAAAELLLACRTLRSSVAPVPQHGPLTPTLADAAGTRWHVLEADADVEATDSDAWAQALLGALGDAACRALLPPAARARDAGALLRAGRRNHFALQDDMLTPLAVASFPLGALLNHGCDANCVMSYDHDDDGWVQRVRAVRRIAAGEVRCRWQVKSLPSAMLMLMCTLLRHAGVRALVRGRGSHDGHARGGAGGRV